MNAPAGKEAKAPQTDPLADLAEKLYVQIAGRLYNPLAATGDAKKPDPKVVAAYCYKLAEAFDQASRETDRAKARIDAENKA